MSSTLGNLVEAGGTKSVMFCLRAPTPIGKVTLWINPSDSSLDGIWRLGGAERDGDPCGVSTKTLVEILPDSILLAVGILVQPLLQIFAFGDIATAQQNATHRCKVQHVRAGQLQPSPATVRMSNADLCVLDFSPGMVLWVDEPEDECAHGSAEDARTCGIDEFDRCASGDDDEKVHCVSRNNLKLLFALGRAQAEGAAVKTSTARPFCRYYSTFVTELMVAPQAYQGWTDPRGILHNI